MDEYGINLTGHLTVETDGIHDIATTSKRIRTVYADTLDLTTPVIPVQPTAPSSPSPGDLWFNTANNILQVRNAADDGWLGVMYGDSNNKIWMYSNTASDGWAIDASVTDVVLALKGGSEAYNVAGGTTGAGDFAIPDHTLIVDEMPNHKHTFPFNHIGPSFGQPQGAVPYFTIVPVADTSSVGGDASHTHDDNAFRPEAAVGTLQYPDSV